MHFHALDGVRATAVRSSTDGTTAVGGAAVRATTARS